MRKHALLGSFFVVLVFGLLLGFYSFLAPHPPRGPAKPVPVSEQKKLLDGLVNRPAYDQHPELAAEVAADPPPASDASGGPEPGTASSVAGRVLDKETGAGIAGASVSLAVGTLKGPVVSADTTRMHAARTDAEGHYEFAGITAFGDVYLSAVAEGYSPARADLDVLRPGTVHDGVDFTLKPAVGVIGGRVLDHARQPIHGALVAVVAGPDGGGPMVFTEETGVFSIALSSEGELTLGVSREGYGSECFSGVQSGMKDLELVLTQAGGIAGRVTDKQGRPKQGLNIVVNMDSSEQGYLWSSSCKTDEDGQYRVDNLSSGYLYAVRVTRGLQEDPPGVPRKLQGLAAHLQASTASELAYEKLVHSTLPGSGLAAQNGVKVTSGQVTTVNLQIEANDAKSSIIYGRVTDPTTGGPACPVTIQGFWHEDVRPDTFLASTTTDRDGYYQMTLSTVTQREKVWVTVGWDRSKAAGSVVADPEVPKELNFSLSAPVTVHVRCVDQEGVSVAGVFITSAVDTITDAQGQATVYGLAPNVSHTLSAYRAIFPAPAIPPQAGGRIGISEPFSGRPGEELEVRILCSPDVSGTVTGQLVVPPEAEEAMYDYTDTLGTCLYYESGDPVRVLARLDRKTNRFELSDVAPGRCAIELWILAPKAGVRWWALLENADILPDQVTDLGVIQFYVSDVMR